MARLPRLRRRMRDRPGSGLSLALFLLAAFGVGLVAGLLYRPVPPPIEGRWAATAPSVAPPPPSGELFEEDSDLQPKVAVHFIDVGQGDAVFIRSRTHSVLIDGGDLWGGARVVDYLRLRQVAHLDWVIATHPHSDHVGGLLAVLDALPIGEFYATSQTYPTTTYRDLLQKIKDRGVPFRVARQGNTLSLGEDVWLQFLAPLESGLDQGEAAIDEGGVVLRLVAGTVKFLFTADIGPSTEDQLIRTVDSLSAQVLKVPRHGDGRCAGDAFLRAVAPDVAVITCGAYNEFGYPDPAVLTRLAGLGAAVYRTDRHGSVAVLTDGERLEVHWSSDLREDVTQSTEEATGQ